MHSMHRTTRDGGSRSTNDGATGFVGSLGGDAKRSGGRGLFALSRSPSLLLRLRPREDFDGLATRRPRGGLMLVTRARGPGLETRAFPRGGDGERTGERILRRSARIDDSCDAGCGFFFFDFPNRPISRE